MKITKLIPPNESSFVVNNFPIRSNTLFGALANSFVELFGEQNFDVYLELFDFSSYFKGQLTTIN